MTLSLRWQVILLATLVLALMATAFAWQQHERLTRQFDAERAATRAAQVTLVTRLFLDESNHLQALSTMLSNLPQLRRGLATRDGTGLSTAFNPIWAELNLGSNLEAARFYGNDGSLLAAWGQQGDGSSLRHLAVLAGQREAPAEMLSCTGSCLYYTAVPLVDRGRFLGALVLGAGLQDLILRFRGLSGVELAVLSPLPAPGRSYLVPLKAHLVSVSGDPGYGDLLRHLDDAALLQGEYHLQHGARQYRVQHFPAPIAEGEASFAVIEDVTPAVQAIHSATHKNLLWGLSVLGLAVILLYSLLMPIMHRFRRVAKALPLLGKGRYDEARGAFPAGRRPIRDEADELGEAATALANTLEELNAQAGRHAAQLADQARQLRGERDFISGLLDTAPALIVTHQLDGPIRLANVHAVQVSGLALATLQRQDFIDSFFSPDQYADLRALLGQLRAGEVRHSEGHFQRPDGSEREVIWFHSLFEADAERPLRLSVGLDVTAHKQAERRLSMLVDHDMVTGLLSRGAFQRELDEVLRATPRQGTLFVCDIDEFKAVNEVSGHEKGDAMLALFARKVMAHEPLPTLAGRLGGDEFALYYAGMSTAESIVAARQFNQALVGIGPGLGLPKHSFTTCVGIALVQEDEPHADSLIANAETALVQARRKGEGNWHLYSPSDPYQADKGRRVFWSDELERALAENRLALHFQPILDLRSRRVSHWESLIRLHDGDGNLVMPGQFMGVAEATGLVRRLDRWVIGEAGRTLRQAFQHQDVRLALNLSGRSLDDEETLETLRQCLMETGVRGDRFILEITETAALADIKSAARLMASYRELGCAFSLDDFGVGYTSFQYLKELPVDSVKIDGSFIVGLKRNHDDQVFVRALTEAVHGFGKQVVAEFVEDGETLDILQEFGVDYAQGYYIGRPSSKLALSLAA
jgi:diguanylate cyclase (GGDEF)-like protein/PAS domain S-box-containing protein